MFLFHFCGPPSTELPTKLISGIAVKQFFIRGYLKYFQCLYFLMGKRRMTKKKKKLGKVAGQSFGGGSVPNPKTGI
mgnify:CR=1 FL=1